MAIVAGVDFGTESVRVSILDSERGRLGFATSDYPVLRASDPDFAAQRHQDHCRALEEAFAAALAHAHIEGNEIKALALDTTGSTVVAVDEHLQPLGDYYLWCDHRAWREAAEITIKAREKKLAALDWSGGTYSSEWGFAKLLHWLRHNPEKRAAFATALEHCDLMVATLCGITRIAELPRSICAMGHKWMWNEGLGGLPCDAFLASVDPLLGGARQKLQGRYATSGAIAGELSPEWAKRLGLRAFIPIPVGALDAHWDAIGAGCGLGDVVNVIGTSTCIMALSETTRLIPGASGIVQGSIHPGKLGIEAGLAAVGSLFDAIARRANRPLAELADEIAQYRPGQTGLLRFAWDNGDRSILADSSLRGITLGWRLNHTAADELFAAMEASAFHTRIVLERLSEYGVPIARVIHAGGIPQRNELINRIYADVLVKPILVPAKSTTSLGSGIFAFLAAGIFASIEEAQESLSPGYRVIEPSAQGIATYTELFARFHELYFTLARITAGGEGTGTISRTVPFF
jgi:L-ribulokinase